MLGLNVTFGELLPARTGHFLLESGYHGNLWLDLDSLFLRPAALQPFAAELAARFAPYGVEAVCGPLTGGAFVAQMVAAALDTEFYFAERKADPQNEALYSARYSIPQALRSRIRGKQVAVVDDVILAGSAIRATLAELEACGARPVVIGALLTLGSSASVYAAVRSLPLESLAYRDSHIWEPGACPLCRAGVPLQDLRP